MAKNESTAINELIHIVHGRIVESTGGDDNLFVTAQPANKRLPGMPPPLPRRRAPAATPAPAMKHEVVIAGGRVSHTPSPDTDFEGEEGATEIDRPKKWFDDVKTVPIDPSMRMGAIEAIAAGRPMPVEQEPYTLPVPALPLEAPMLTPCPLPPVPPTPMQVMQAQMQPQMMQPQMMQPQMMQPQMQPRAVTQYPVPDWASQPQPSQPMHPLPLPYPMAQQSAVQPRYVVPPSAAIFENDQNAVDTVRVPTLPSSEVMGRSFGQELRGALSRFALPFGGAVILLVFVAGALVHSGQGGKKRSEAPVKMTVSSPIAGAAVATVAPVVADKPLWQPRATAPTIVKPTVEPIVEPIAEPVAVAPVAAPVVEKVVEKKSSSSSSRRAARRAAAKQVAAIEMKKPEKAELKLEKKVETKLDKKADKKSKRLAKRGAASEEIEVENPDIKPTGPGKLMVSSNIPTLIYVDGRSTNLMTPKTLNLTPGTHKITLLEIKTRKAKTSDIKIDSGKMAKLDRAF